MEVPPTEGAWSRCQQVMGGVISRVALGHDTFIGFLVGPSCPAHRFATPWVVDTDIGTGRILEENPIRTASMFGSTSCVFCLQYITDQAITSWVGRGICCSLHKAFLKLQKKACSALESVTSWS